MYQDPNTIPASLGEDINKTTGGEGAPETKVGVSGPKVPELTLDMPDDEIVKLTDQWEKEWNESDVKQDWIKAGKENEKYWLGKQFDGPKVDKTRSMVDNVIFEAEETYISQTLRRNPDPMVDLDKDDDPTPQEQEFIAKVKKRLTRLIDKLRIRLKLKTACRHWSIYLLAVVKYGWNLDNNMPAVQIVRPWRVILDPKATVDEDGYTGNRVGHIRKLELSVLRSSIEKNNKATPEKMTEFDELMKDHKEGTQIQFQEWWTPEYMCWKYKKAILLKKKNPHWNYDKTAPGESVDAYGNVTPTTEPQKGVNFFPVPKMPFSFLSVYNLGSQPVDKTSNIGQNLANQDRVNKRNKQIDKNVDKMNGGMVVSIERSGLTEAQAKNVSAALQKGGVVAIPSGSVQDAVGQYQANPLPPDVFNDLQDTRTRMRDIFGTRGSTPAGITSEDTVRGKIISRGLDTDRIGGGVSEYLEQLADEMYGWLVQLEYVYDADFQPVPGAEFPPITVSVKEGSLLPKDSTTIANQAIDLANNGHLSTLDLFKRLEYPNPEELAANAWLEKNAPDLLYPNDPRIKAALERQAQAAQAEAEAKAAEGQASHANAMEAQKLKNRGTVVNTAAKSLLAEAPQSTA